MIKGPRHFIPQSLHFWSHFIPKGKIVTSYQSLHTKSLHTKRYFIPVTSYQSLHTKVTSYQSLHTSHFIPRVTSYQALHTKSHFIPGTSYQSLHTKNHFIPDTSYQSHFIPKPPHTKVTSYQSLHTETTSYQSHFIIVISCRPLHISALMSVHSVPNSHFLVYNNALWPILTHGASNFLDWNFDLTLISP